MQQMGVEMMLSRTKLLMYSVGIQPELIITTISFQSD